MSDDTMVNIGCGLLIVLLFGFLVALSAWYAYGTKDTVTDTVKKSERVCSGGESGSCEYLVFGQKEVYTNHDSWWYWKFNSSDFYRDIENESTYTFTVYGWRVPFLSWYRNIIEVKKLP